LRKTYACTADHTRRPRVVVMVVVPDTPRPGPAMDAVQAAKGVARGDMGG
jgi:hypothetical protein